MYSGNDSTEAQSYTQWALNPSAYQNMSNDQVDWAALAQQWIIMKEAGPPVPEQVTNAPPPQNLSKPLKKDVPVEGGEAPMEVENDSEDVQPQWNDGGGSGDSWSWNQQPPQQQSQQPQQQQSWGWGNTWSAPSGVPPPNSVKTPLLPTPPAYNQYSSNDNCNDNGNFGYSSAPSSDYQGGYWTAAGSSKVIKPHNKRYSKVNVPTPVATSPKPVTIDAAKRKQLPAWIREGLEKMERDKLKQLDKERERQEKEEYDAKVKLNEKNALEILKNTVKEQQKSKFESDADDSGDDADGRPLTPEPIALSQEELMLKVRRTMTEILLKVTNRDIYNICREELQRHLKKLKASDHRVSAPSGANLSAKLGLGAYGGSGSSSDSSDDESSKDHQDSDADLKDTIKRRKAEFTKTEREIEDKLAEADRYNGEDSRAASPDNSDNDSQVDAKLPGGGRSRVDSFERTPPIKTSQNSKRRSRKTSSSSEDTDSDADRSSRSKDRRRDRRSSSTLSSRSDKYKRSRNSRSGTPDRKQRQKYSFGDNDRRSSKYSESKQSRRSRSKSIGSSKRRRSRSSSVKRGASRRDSRYSKRSQTRSRSRSSTRSRQRLSYDRSRSTRSTSRSRRSSSKTYTSRRRRSRSRQRSRSPVSSHRHRRSRSHSTGRGKRSHRH